LFLDTARYQAFAFFKYEHLVGTCGNVKLIIYGSILQIIADRELQIIDACYEEATVNMGGQSIISKFLEFSVLHAYYFLLSHSPLALLLTFSCMPAMLTAPNAFVEVLTFLRKIALHAAKSLPVR
jgi:hypothetical protein